MVEPDRFESLAVGQPVASVQDLPRRQAPIRLIPTGPVAATWHCRYFTDGNLRTILTSDRAVQIVGEAIDGNQAVEQVGRCVPDVVLLDIRMPGGDGLTAAAEIRRRWPGQRLILLTTFGESEYVRRAVSLGVNGFLLKAGDPRDLLAGLRAVMAGGACLACRGCHGHRRRPLGRR
ncbi:response regulator [Actinoplanes solisilvae]|uniref:response regulator n=1 Tax=Actinoplanes solisilvae TaxID=2486853 RepID=UPI001F0C5BA6|nr:response regulator transcription factor [Actinoplanes solisilvae]